MVYAKKYSFSVMADPETNSYDGKISGNLLVLGSTASGKQLLLKRSLLTLCLESSRVLTGYQLSSFPRRERL